MSGLLDKARKVLQGPPKPARRGGESDISDEERRALLAEIDGIVAKARGPLAAGPDASLSRRRDLLLPALVNAGAIAIIAAAALIIPAVLGGRGEMRSEQEGTALAGEAALVGSLKRESEQAIHQIETSLQSAQKERDALKAGADEQVRRREEELSASLNAQLEQERERLRSEGASSAAIERQLRTMEQQRRTELERQVADYQRQLDTELARRDAEIAALRAQSSRGQEESQRMTALAAQSQGEQLVLDQITGSYGGVGAAMKAGKWDDARAGLTALGSYLDQPAVAALPSVQKRRTVDLFLIDSLQRLAQAQGAAGQSSQAAAAMGQSSQAAAAVGRGGPDPRALATARAVSDAISEGNRLYAAGDFKGSLARYGDALQALKENAPGVETLGRRISDAGFRQGMADLAARQDREAQAAFDKAQALAARGANADAVASWLALIQAYPQSSYVKRSTDGIQAAVQALAKKSADDAVLAERASRDASAAQKQEELRAAAREKLRAMAESLSDTARKSSKSAATAREELIALLQVKVDVRQILLSDAVRAQHPDLASKLDRFLDLTAEVRRAEGRAAAMKDAAAVIDSLAGGTTATDVSPLLQKYSDDAQRSSFQKFLDALREVFF